MKTVTTIPTNTINYTTNDEYVNIMLRSSEQCDEARANGFDFFYMENARYPNPYIRVRWSDIKKTLATTPTSAINDNNEYVNIILHGEQEKEAFTKGLGLHLTICNGYLIPYVKVKWSDLMKIKQELNNHFYLRYRGF